MNYERIKENLNYRTVTMRHGQHAKRINRMANCYAPNLADIDEAQAKYNYRHKNLAKLARVEKENILNKGDLPNYTLAPMRNGTKTLANRRAWLVKNLIR